MPWWHSGWCSHLLTRSRWFELSHYHEKRNSNAIVSSLICDKDIVQIELIVSKLCCVLRTLSMVFENAVKIKDNYKLIVGVKLT